MRTKLLLLLGTLVAALLGAEIVLRITMPELAAQNAGASGPSPFRYDARIGYELQPFARVESVDEAGRRILERMNREGFRGPEYAIPKPQGTFRILAVGDSVVQGLSVAYSHSWEQVLERMLNTEARRAPRYEVLNSGIGGYVSWQALRRLTDRGLKYEPDLVLILVGWNDLIFSSVAYWTPKTNLTDFEQAFVAQEAARPPPSRWWQIRQFVYKWSYAAQLVRQARNRTFNVRRIRDLIAQRQVDGAVAFNEAALRVYVRNLEQIRAAIKSHNARMAVIVWPTILTPELLSNPEVHKRLVLIYSLFPLSTRQLWEWYSRYAEALQRFAAHNPDVILIDARRHLERVSREERLRLFSDLAHLTEEGNSRLASIVFADLRAARALPEGR